MLENIVGRKIELMPKVPKENEILCTKCGGTGWLLKDDKWLETCECGNGLITCCPRCGKPYAKRYSHHCDNQECIDVERLEDHQKELQKEKDMFNRAIKVNIKSAPKEVVEMMYSEVYGYNEGYFSDIDELEDYCKENDIEMPFYVWGTEKMALRIDACSIVEDACSDLHEDAYANITDEHTLQEFLDKWCEEQRGVDTYYVNYKYAILF